MTDPKTNEPAEIADDALDAAQGGATIGSLSASMQKVRTTTAAPSAHSGGVNVLLGDGSVRF